MTKKLISFTLVAIISACMATSLTAAPFAKKIKFAQPNGTTIELRGQGDEFYAVFETLDGYTVVFDPNTKSYQYAKLSADNTELVPTGMQVGQGHPLSLGITKHLRINADSVKNQTRTRFQKWDRGMEIIRRWNERKAIRHQAEQATAGRPALAPPSSTTTGNKIGLCLLIDFDNDPATVLQTNIANFCNGDSYTGYGNNGSVKKYFQDNSAGLLTYSNVVTAYVRIPNSLHSKSYYNNITQDAGENANLLIQDAITIMKALPNYTTEILPAFNNLSVDANSNVVACNVFYAGDNGSVWSMGLWPHSWSLWNVGAQSLSAGGKKVFRYQITNIGSSLELGTFCHENGHMLCDFPDIYDYTYNSVGGAGSFCLMGYGGFGANPVQIDAYLKWAAGWATTTELTSISDLAASLTASAGPEFNHFYRFQKPGVPTEYFLVENRQQAGRDELIEASGIAIWHVDELGDRDNRSLTTNSLHANFELTLVQADNQWHFQNNINYGDARDLYYNGNLAAVYSNRFTDSTLPSARWWNGSFSSVNFHGFSANGDTMTFVVGDGISASIGLAPTSLSYTVVLGNGNPSPQTFMVTNNGLAAFNFTNSISYSPNSGTNIWFTPSAMTGHVDASGSLSVTGSIDSTGLAIGAYYATNIFSSTNADNSPQTLVVTLQVLNPIQVIPTSLTYTADQGGTNPSSQIFVVTNGGLTAFNFTNAISYSPSSGTNIWFTPSVMTGHVDVAGSLTVTGSINITNLNEGVHYATNTFTSPEIPSPQTLVVTLRILNPARLWVEPTNFSKMVTAGQTPVGDVFHVSNTGAGVMAYTVTTTTNWLSVSQTNGNVQAGNTNEISIGYNTSGLAEGWYTGRVDVAALGEGVGTQSVYVTLQVNYRPGLAWNAGNKIWTNEALLGTGSIGSTTVEVWNASAAPIGLMNYTVSVIDNPAGWVSVSNASGSSTGNHQQVYVNYSQQVITQLAIGVYTATLKMEGTDASTGMATTNGPLLMGLKLTIHGTPILKTDVTSLSQTVLQNHTGTNRFLIWNEGQTPRGGMSYTVTVTPNVSWATVSPTSGSVTNNTNSIQVILGTTTLAPGTYLGALVVNAFDTQTGTPAVNAPMTIPLTLTVTPRTPLNLELPTVVGAMYVGQTVEADVGLWLNQARLTFAYQWQRASNKAGDGLESLNGAVGPTYVITTADRGKFLRVGVTATDPDPSPISSTAYSVFTDRAKVKALRADFNGDGITDLWFYDGASGTWRASFGALNSAEAIFPGGSGMVAVPGDYDGDGYEDLGVYEPAHGIWHILYLPRGNYVFGSLFGGTPEEAAATPVVADFDGDGATDLGLYYIGYWAIRYSSLGAIVVVQPFADTQGIPVTGDWDGNGTTEMGVYQGGLWTLRMANGSIVEQEFGGSGVQISPAQGDYDGDGVTDLGVYDVIANQWRWRESRTGFEQSISFGLGGIIAIPGYYDHDRSNDWAQAFIYNNDFIVWEVKRTAEPANYPYPYHGQSYQMTTDRWRVSW